MACGLNYIIVLTFFKANSGIIIFFFSKNFKMNYIIFATINVSLSNGVHSVLTVDVKLMSIIS